MTSRAPPGLAVGLDALHLPIIGRVLRNRWGRLAAQGPVLLLASLVLYDGLTGPPLAPTNLATVLVWIHFRGLVVIALLLVGNLFCMACPFTVPRSLARWFGRRTRRFPRWLRGKGLALAFLVGAFWLYEWADLWSSPRLTAYVTLGYFAAAFALESLFTESPFCKYVCPLGTFNFALSTASPVAIAPRRAEVCAGCKGKECVRGSKRVSGCGTELYVPAMTSNLDCTLCLDCARACPYDNVALRVRRPLEELTAARPLFRRGWTLLVFALCALGLLNAFGMVRPVHEFHAWLAGRLGLHSEALRLSLLFLLGGIGVPALSALGAAWLSRSAAGAKGIHLWQWAGRYAPAFVPMGLGIWMAHYGFHFAVGGLAILPVAQSFLLDHGVRWLGPSPNWDLSYVIPPEWVFPLQVLSILAGFSTSLYLLAARGLRAGEAPLTALKQLLPWGILLVLTAAASLSVFNLPMEMRGTVIGAGG